MEIRQMSSASVRKFLTFQPDIFGVFEKFIILIISFVIFNKALGL